MNCFQCEKAVGPNQGISCDTCFAIYHKACVRKHGKDALGLLTCCSESFRDVFRESQALNNNADSGNTSVTSSPAPRVGLGDNHPADAALPAVSMSRLEDCISRIMARHNVEMLKQLSEIQSKLTEHSALSATNRDNIADLRSEVASLKEEVRVLKASSAVGSQVDSMGEGHAPSCDSLTAELQDRMNRASNVILYNVPADTGVSNLTAVKSSLAKIANINWGSMSVIRFPRPSRRSNYPPVLVKFGSSHEAQRVVRESKLLPKTIEVTFDYTESQRRQYRNLKDVAATHNKKNPQAPKVVRYIKGTPTLVDSKNQPRHVSRPGPSKN